MKLYGEDWPEEATELQIEFGCIRRGGLWFNPEGYPCGRGLYHHYLRVWKLLWPEDDHHRWAEQGLRRICENDITVLMGPADSAKTYLMAKFVVSDWWADPFATLWMASSTDRRGAELRIWGKIKEFYNRGKARFPWLPGRVLESKGCITPDQISEDQETARLLTRGIIFIPCKQGNTWLGLGPYAGIKPPTNGRMGHAGDEVSLMHPSFLDAYANWYGKRNFRGLLTGNPGDLEDPLCKAAEPIDGWETFKDTDKTQEWRSRFYNAWVIAFDGLDTPNNDFPYVDGYPRYSYLIGKKKLDAVRNQYGENDWHWFNQCKGKPQTSTQSRRVITRQLVKTGNASADVIWSSDESITKLASLDAAYGGIGGDRCVIRTSEFGTDVDGNLIFAVNPPDLVPVSVRKDEPPEVQIAKFCKLYCESRKIPPNLFGFDGRSTLAIAFAQEWSAEVSVVDFGGPATERPVSNEEWIWEGDMQTKRLKTCREHYFNFVTELWFSVYYLILCGQMRRLDVETAAEGYQRTWMMHGNRIQVEPKPEMKERTKQSPDNFDSLVVGLELARRNGFEIQSIRGTGKEIREEAEGWLKNELAKRKRFLKASELSYAQSS